MGKKTILLVDAEMKKATALALASILLFSAVVGTLLVNTTKADPYVPPPELIITMLSPESDKAYASTESI
jgi:hypothetical protein